MYGSCRPRSSTRWKYGFRSDTKTCAGGPTVERQGWSVGMSGLSIRYIAVLLVVERRPVAAPLGARELLQRIRGC